MLCILGLFVELRFGILRVKKQRRGAALHIYSDVSRHEPYCEDIAGLVVASDILDYTGIRIDRCRRCAIDSGWKVSRAVLGPAIVTNSTEVTLP